MSRDELCVFMVLTGKDGRKVFFVESSLWLSCKGLSLAYSFFNIVVI